MIVRFIDIGRNKESSEIKQEEEKINSKYLSFYGFMNVLQNKKKVQTNHPPKLTQEQFDEMMKYLSENTGREESQDELRR